MLYIICYPLSLLLDWILGAHHEQRYTRKDIKALLKLHVGEGPLKVGNKSLNREELNLINSTMDLRDEPVTK
jgi:CBS domain containing-hemolysin-like protein